MFDSLIRLAYLPNCCCIEFKPTSCQPASSYRFLTMHNSA